MSKIWPTYYFDSSPVSNSFDRCHFWYILYNALYLLEDSINWQTWAWVYVVTPGMNPLQNLSVWWSPPQSPGVSVVNAGGNYHRSSIAVCLRPISNSCGESWRWICFFITERLFTQHACSAFDLSLNSLKNLM